MKRISIILLLSIFCFYFIPQTETAKVVKVIDGDTIVLQDGTKIRYIGMDTPERGMPLFEEAKKANADLVQNKEIRLVYDVERKDRYGRTLAYVHVNTDIGNIFVNAYLVREGYAKVATYPPNVKYVDVFKKLQKQAQENKVGLWAVSTKVNAEDEYSGLVVASKNSKVYHKPDCRNAKRIKEANLIKYKNPAEAQRAGKRAGKCCFKEGIK